jgi:hypothetical protein
MDKQDLKSITPDFTQEFTNPRAGGKQTEGEMSMDANEELLQKLIDSEPARQEGKHRFLGGTCVDCGHPFDLICTANLDLPKRNTTQASNGGAQ